MTDDELREAAARALGWSPAGLGQWYVQVPMTEPKVTVRRNQAPPLDWTTAGKLLEMCPRVEVHGEYGALALVRVDANGWVASEREWDTLNARNVIEACVMALGDKPPSATHDQSIA